MFGKGMKMMGDLGAKAKEGAAKVQEKFTKKEEPKPIAELPPMPASALTIDNWSPPQEAVLKVGLLKKVQHELLGVKNYHTHYWMLFPNRLIYCKSAEDMRPKGIINFDFNCADVRLVEKGAYDHFEITVLGSKKNFVLQAADKNECFMWIEALKKQIDLSFGSQNHLTAKDGERWWRHNRILTAHVEAIATSGDVLLFQTDNIGATLQRKATSSEFDHAALLIKFEHEGLYIMEATSDEGVALTPWRDFLDYGPLSYIKVIFRKMVYPRTAENMIKLREWVKSAYGHKYGLTPQKLLLMEKEKKPEDQPEVDKEKTFFCSELVANGLKVLGAIDQKTSAAKLWPVNFSIGKEIALVPGAFFADELLLQYS